jgi:hypothetical protein
MSQPCQGLFLWRRNPFEIKVISEKPINQESLLFMGGLISKTKDPASRAASCHFLLEQLFSPCQLTSQPNSFELKLNLCPASPNSM